MSEALEYIQVFMLGGIFFFLMTLAWALVSQGGYRIPFRATTAIAMTGWAVMILNVLVIRIFGFRGSGLARSVFYIIGCMDVPLIVQMMRSMTSQKNQWKMPLLCELPFLVLMAVSIASGKHGVCNDIAICYCALLLTYAVCSTFVKVRRFNIQLSNSYSDEEHRDLKWIKSVAWLILGFSVLYSILQINSSPVSRIIFDIITFVVWGMIYLNVSRQKPVDTEMLEETALAEDDETAISEKGGTKTSKATSTRRDDIIGAALYDCIVTKKVFLDPDITIKSLASMIGTNTSYMSAHLNEKEGKNFATYINEFRLDYAENLLKTQPELGLDKIASMSGFSSMQTFHRLFKARNGCTPRQFTGD